MLKEEKKLLDGFSNRANRSEEIIRLLTNLFKENDLPEDVWNSEDLETDSINVNWFANKLEDYALELSELAENMKVGALMEKAWSEKEENTMTYSEKLADLCHKEGDF